MKEMDVESAFRLMGADSNGASRVAYRPGQFAFVDIRL